MGSKKEQESRAELGAGKGEEVCDDHACNSNTDAPVVIYDMLLQHLRVLQEELDKAYEHVA